MGKLVEIEVTIERGGKTTIDAKGFAGDACLKETATLEEALGKVSGRDMKPEATKKNTVADTTKVGN
jgi:hypothetical protein